MTDPRKPIFDAVRSGARAGLFNDPGNIHALNNLLDAFGVGREAAPPDGPPAHKLGSLSEHYESGGRGPGAVSTGLHDPGGVSYGTYQLATKTGTVAAFIAAEGTKWARDFAGLKPGTPTFTAAWQLVAKREPAAFAEAQHAFIERTHYRPTVKAVLDATGLDLDSRADAIRDATWSVSVQHGKAALILNTAVREVDAQGLDRAADAYDRALLAAIYAARSDYVRKVAAVSTPTNRATLLGIVANRYPDEFKRAQEMLA